MKTAKQALDETINNLTTESNRELFEVSLKIDEVVKNGKFYICERGQLNSLTVYELQKLGYGVTHDCNDSTWYYFVSWFACDVDGFDKSATYNHVQDNTTTNTCDKTNNKRNKGKFPIFRR